MTDYSRPAPGDQPGLFPSAGNSLDMVEYAFSWMCTRPHPITINGATVYGLPRRVIPLDDLRAMLLAPDADPAMRDAVWRHLIVRSRTEGGAWTVACAAMARPVLGRVVRVLTDRFAGDPADIHAAVLTGFLHGLTRVDLDGRALVSSLRWASYRAGLAAVRDALDAPTPHGLAVPTSMPSAMPAADPGRAGHPDLVLARAVADGVLTSAEADLISSTRLGDTSLAEAAAARGQSYTATRAARLRAEHRLLTYLSTPDTDPHPDADARSGSGSGGPLAPPGAGREPGRAHRRGARAGGGRTRSRTASGSRGALHPAPRPTLTHPALRPDRTGPPTRCVHTTRDPRHLRGAHPRPASTLPDGDAPSSPDAVVTAPAPSPDAGTAPGPRAFTGPEAPPAPDAAATPDLAAAPVLPPTATPADQEDS